MVSESSCCTREGEGAAGAAGAAAPITLDDQGIPLAHVFVFLFFGSASGRDHPHVMLLIIFLRTPRQIFVNLDNGIWDSLAKLDGSDFSIFLIRLQAINWPCLQRHLLRTRA